MSNRPTVKDLKARIAEVLHEMEKLAKGDLKANIEQLDQLSNELSRLNEQFKQKQQRKK